MATEILSSLCQRLGVKSEAIKRKAEELYRLLEIRSTGSVNISSTCQAVICIELAALQSGERIDRSEGIKISGTQKKVYLSNVGMIQCVLGLQNSMTIPDLVVQFGCTEAKSLALQILKRYEDSVRGRQAGISEQPVFSAAAIYIATKKLNMKIDKRKLIEATGTKKSVFDNIAQEMEKLSVTLFDTSKKSVKSEGGGTAVTIEAKSKEMDEDGRVENNNEACSDDEEPFEDWKKRILMNAYEQLGRVYQPNE